MDINKLLNNIENSSVSAQKKSELIIYAKLLSSKELPVFFDDIHLRTSLNIPVDIKIDDFVRKETLSHFVRKRSGELRVISSPNYNLKQMQRWILTEVFSHQIVSQYAHGFIKNRSILTNAQSHIHQEESWVLNIDLRDFFSSITYEDVFKLFYKMGYNIEVSEIFAKLCTFENRLAQGFPTSPYIANLYLYQFDENMGDYIKNVDDSVVYTRYADDLVFSGVKKRGYTRFIAQLIQTVESELELINLCINTKKTRIQKKSVKRITGLNVSANGVSISKSYVKTLKQTIYYCKKFGIIDHLKYHGKEDISNFKGYLYGQAYFIKMIDNTEGAFVLKELNGLDWI